MNWKTIPRKLFNILGIETPGEAWDIIWRQKILRKPYWWSNFPLVFNIDTCNYCGPKYSGVLCQYCFPQNQIVCGKMQHQEMPMDQIEWILQNINKYGSEMREAAKKHMGYGSWDPFLNGDPLANPRLPEIMRLGKKLAPGIDVEVYTCGSLTDNAWMLCSRDVDLLHVTLSAHNPEIYRKVHRGDQFGNVLRTLKYITENRKSNQKLYINYIMTETNIPYMHEWYKLIGDQFPDWQRIFSPLIISPDNVYAKAALGKLSLQDQENAIRDINPDAGMWYAESTSLRQPCALWANASVLADGTLVKCCNWYDPEKHNYGNIKDYMKNGYDLHDFWMMRIANKHNNAVCESCTLRRADAKERLDKMKVKITVVT